MARKSQLLTEKVVETAKKSLKKLGKEGLIAIKLRAILSAYEHGITQTCKVFQITKTTLTSWIKHIKNESIEKLKVQKGRGPKSRISAEYKQSIQSWIQSDPQLTIDQIRRKLKDELGLDVGRSTVHRATQSLNFAYITPRPQHYKQDTEKLPEAKKKSKNND